MTVSISLLVVSISFLVTTIIQVRWLTWLSKRIADLEGRVR